MWFQTYIRKKKPWAILAMSFSCPTQVQVKIKTFSFDKILITSELFIHIKNVKILTHITDIPCVLNVIYYREKTV